MAFRRDVPLVATVERVVQLTGRTDLRNLEASGELNLEDLLRSASATVHDKLQARGVRPEEVTNPEVYENAVAWQFLGVLAESAPSISGGIDKSFNAHLANTSGRNIKNS